MPLISTSTGASAKGFSHMASSIPPGFNNNSVLAIGNSSSPYLNVYKFNDVTGFGTKYANPATLPNSQRTGVKFSSDGSVIFSSGNSTVDGVSAYAWNSSTGFGTKYASASFADYTYGIDVNPSKTVVVASSWSSPYINAWAWSGGFGSKYADPATITYIGLTNSITFNPAGNVVAMAGSNTPYIVAYAWSGGFGSKYADPVYNPGLGSSQNDLMFSPDGTAIAMSNIYATVYAWSSGFGARYTNPAALVSFVTDAVAFNPAGNVITIANGNDYSGILLAYAWNSSTGFGTKYANATPDVYTNSSYDMAWNPTGTAVAFTDALSPYIHVYSWSNGFRSKYANPVTLPNSTSKALAFI